MIRFQKRREFRLTILGAGLGLLVAALPGKAHADIYRYVDANGVMHFTNTPTNNRYSFYRKEEGGRGNPSPSRDTANVAHAVNDIIRRYAGLFNLEEALIRAVIKAESNFNPKAVSKKGAMGIMQLIPETARIMDVEDPFNPEQNIRGGSRYLRDMLNQFDNNLELAIAAYNAGPNAVRRYGGIPPYEETKTYVQRVKKYLLGYRKNSLL